MSSFFAWLARLRLIRRWGLMYAAQPENDAEHSLQVAMIAHGLALIARERYGREVDAGRAVTLAIYHDASEIFTGDLPTPVKHHDGVIRDAYHRQEAEAIRRLTASLPEDLRAAWQPSLTPDETSYEWRLVKAADKISAWCRCAEELGAGNREFLSAEKNLRDAIEALPLDEVRDFMRDFAPAFGKTLDEL